MTEYVSPACIVLGDDTHKRRSYDWATTGEWAEMAFSLAKEKRKGPPGRVASSNDGSSI